MSRFHQLLFRILQEEVGVVAMQHFASVADQSIETARNHIGLAGFLVTVLVGLHHQDAGRLEEVLLEGKVSRVAVSSSTLAWVRLANSTECSYSITSTSSKIRIV